MPVTTSSSVADKRLAKLASMGESRLYAKNEILINEGEVSGSLFLLTSGQLKVFTRDPAGRELVYNILEPGEILGEMFLDRGTRSASVKVLVDSECIVVEESRIHELVHKSPAFTECLVEILIARLRNATATIKSLVLSDVHGRTAALLNTIALSEGKLKVVPARITQQEIADRVGATREMINHVISDLLKSGYLRRDERRRLVFRGQLPLKAKPKSS